MQKKLPHIQLILAVIFGAVSIFGPMLTPQGSLVIFLAALTGILLGGVTFYIGWLLEVKRASIRYPFADWSRRILLLFLSPGQARGLKPANSELSSFAREAIGILSLILGPLLVIALVVMVILVLRP